MQHRKANTCLKLSGRKPSPSSRNIIVHPLLNCLAGSTTLTAGPNLTLTNYLLLALAVFQFPFLLWACSVTVSYGCLNKTLPQFLLPLASCMDTLACAATIPPKRPRHMILQYTVTHAVDTATVMWICLSLLLLQSHASSAMCLNCTCAPCPVHAAAAQRFELCTWWRRQQHWRSYSCSKCGSSRE